jgi:hypothetical protein
MTRKDTVNYIDETSWFKAGKLHWLWVMATSGVALYLVHPNRSREAFNELVRHWQGILVSDNYRVYQNWIITAKLPFSLHPQDQGAFGKPKLGNCPFRSGMLCLL